MSTVLTAKLESTGWVSRQFTLTETSLLYEGGEVDLAKVSDVLFLGAGQRRELCVRRSFLVINPANLFVVV